MRPAIVSRDKGAVKRIVILFVLNFWIEQNVLKFQTLIPYLTSLHIEFYYTTKIKIFLVLFIALKSKTVFISANFPSAISRENMV